MQLVIKDVVTDPASPFLSLGWMVCADRMHTGLQPQAHAEDA